MISAVQLGNRLLGHEAQTSLANKTFRESIRRVRKGDSQKGVLEKLAHGSQKRKVRTRRAGAHGQGTRMGYSHRACR